jgi:hypothetical protein
VCVPITDDGARRLAVELERAHEVVDPPLPVWLFDTSLMRERRAHLHARSDGAPPRALLVWHERGPVDVVVWVCEPFVRARRGG